MNYWVVKGRPDENDFDAMLVPDEEQAWRTRRPLPKQLAEGDFVFIWASSPCCEFVGLAQFRSSIDDKDEDGNNRFLLKFPWAPARLSTTTVCPRTSCKACPTTLVTLSVTEPAGKGATRVMGFEGNSCACAKEDPARITVTNQVIFIRLNMLLLNFVSPSTCLVRGFLKASTQINN